VKLNELNLNQMFGDYGAAAMKQAGNRLTGKAEGNLSVQDKIAKDKFISDFIGRASTNLNSAIQSGLVDPNIKAGAVGAVEPQQDATPEPSANTTPQQPATSASPKTPAEIQKEKLAAAAKVAQDQMANSPAPAKPSAPVAPAQQTKMTPQQTAALKGRLKAGAAPTSGQSGFKNYVGGSGQVQRESRYAKLDYILESIINIDEAQEAQSISEYLQNMFNQYLGVPITDPKAKAQIKTLADQAQASYPKMTNALTQLANLGFAISYSQGSGETQGANVGATTAQPTSGASAFSQGMKQGLGSSDTETSPSASTPTSAAATAQTGSAYDQVMSLVSKLSSEEKKQLIATLQEPSSGGAGAFDQMGKQLQQPKTTANPVNRQQKLNVNKIKSGNKGAPTPDEEAKLQQRIQQQLAAQA
jgi:hypothetical protein